MIRRSIINLVGGLVPAVMALTCIPLILNRHGSEFFGAYSIQTSLLMMVGLMDLGISRGILLVTYDRTLNPSGAPNLPVKAGMQLTQWVSLAMFLLTLGGLSVMAYWGSISADVRTSMLLHALSGALTILTLPLRALLEIQGKFGALNIIRSLLACSVPLAPLLPGLGEGLALTAAAAYVLAVRLAGLWSYRRACGLGAMKLGQVPTPERSWQRAFVSRCGWVGLTNVGSLMLTYADRLVLGSIASVTEVANYVVAHELATKIWMVTGAILSAATPKVAADLLTQQTSGLIETPASIHQVKWFIVGAVVVPSVILAALLRPALDLWLGTGYSLDIAVASKILIAGMALNSMSQLNFGLLQLLQGELQGAQLQLANIVVATVLMAIFIPLYGAVGAAIAFSLRLVFDGFLTRILLMRKSKTSAGFRHREFGFVLASFLLLISI